MRTFTKTAAFITAMMAANFAQAEDTDWYIDLDSTLDGQLVNPTNVHLKVRIYQDHFIIENPTDRSVSVVQGKIERSLADGTPLAAPMLSYEVRTDQYYYRYVGAAVGTGQYKGTWFSGHGDSGDFELNTTGTPNDNPIAMDINSANSNSSQSGHGPNAIIDGELGDNDEHSWISGTLDSDPWISFSSQQITLVQTYKLARGYCHTVNNNQPWAAYTPTTWELHGSTDGVNWTLIDTVATSQVNNFPVDGCGSMGTQEYVVDNPGSYQHYRFDFDSGHTAGDPGNLGVGIGEVRMYE